MWDLFPLNKKPWLDAALGNENTPFVLERCPLLRLRLRLQIGSYFLYYCGKWRWEARRRALICSDSAGFVIYGCFRKLSRKNVHFLPKD